MGGAAGKIIDEVRRQFAENPKILTGEEPPDYAKAVDITARAALRGMVFPGLIPVLGPVFIGVVFHLNKQYDAAMAVAALLMVGTIGGILLASYMNNGGGAWDNAKKFIEAGLLIDEDGTVQGKGSPAHAASVVGDTVGDPLKDTAGPPCTSSSSSWPPLRLSSRRCLFDQRPHSLTYREIRKAKDNQFTRKSRTPQGKCFPGAFVSGASILDMPSWEDDPSISN